MRADLRRTARALAVMLLGWTANASLRADEAPVYTLEECLEIGLQRAGTLKNALRDRDIAETTVGQVAAQVYPHLSARAAYTRLDERQSVTFGEQSVELGALDNYSAGLSLQQLLYSGGSVRAALQAAANYRDLESHRLDRVRSELIRDIRAAFADLLLLDGVVEVHEQTVSQLRETLDQTQRRFEQDAVSEFDLLNARVQLQNAIPDRIRAVNDRTVARTAFRNLLDLEEEHFTLSGELHAEPFEAHLHVLLDSALRRRPELAIMEKQVALREADVRAEQGAYLPRLHLNADFIGENPATVFDSGAEWDWSWRAGLQLSWNWLDGGLRRYTVRQKRLEREKALEDLDLARKAVELQVRQAWLRAGHASEALGVARENIALAEKSMRIAAQRYASGLTTRLEMTEVNLALARARLNHLRALRDHHHAVNDLSFAVGAYAADPGGPQGEETP